MALGKLQKPFEWNGQLVCGSCHRMLMLDAGAPKKEAVPAIKATVAEEPLLPPVRARRQPTEFSLAIRTACLGLVFTAIALWAIVSILQSVGYLVLWGAVGIAVIAAIYWIRKGIIAFRRRNEMRGL
jgi:hypothetical protein